MANAKVAYTGADGLVGAYAHTHTHAHAWAYAWAYARIKKA